MKNTQIDRYQTCIIHGEVAVVPSTNGTEYTELCPVCETEKSMSAEDASAEHWAEYVLGDDCPKCGVS